MNFPCYLLGMIFGSGNAMMHLASDPILRIAGVAMVGASVLATMAILFYGIWRTK